MKLIQFDKLKTMVERSCVCNKSKAPVIFTQQTFGISTNIKMECCNIEFKGKMDGHCKANHYDSIDADKFGEDEDEKKEKKKKKKEFSSLY